MPETENPIAKEETEESSQLILEDIRVKAAELLRLEKKDVEGLTQEEIFRKNELLNFLRSVENTENLRSEMTELRKKQLNEVGDGNYLENDRALLCGLQIVFEEKS